MTTPANPADQQGSRPVPDPTILTTEALTREIAHVKELFGEKFLSVAKQLENAEEQRREQKADTAKAIDAALQAQGEAANKSEAAIEKRLEGLALTFNNGLGNLGEGVKGVENRLTRIEAIKIGGNESRAGLYAAIGVAITVVLAVLSVIAFAQAP